MNTQEVDVRRLSLCLLAFVVALSAQEFRGTLTGRVTDPAGLGVPGAKILIVKTDTNTRTETVTGQDGDYTAPFLAPGAYQVSAEAQGFKKFIQSGIDLGTNGRVTVDVQIRSAS